MSVVVEDLYAHFRPLAPLSKWWRGRIWAPPVEALSGISFQIEPGSRVALLGPNGAGKSTLLRTLAGLLTPSKGRAITPGRVALGVGEGRSFHLRLSALENLRLFEALGGARRGRAEESLARVGLEAQARTPARALSTGQLARLGLARALIGAPDVLLLDEISRGVDGEGRARVRSLLEAEAAAGRIILAATHRPDFDLFERGLVLREGRLIADGPLDRALEAYTP